MNLHSVQLVKFYYKPNLDAYFFHLLEVWEDAFGHGILDSERRVTTRLSAAVEQESRSG